MGYLIIIIFLIILVAMILKRFKTLKCSNLALVTGAVKSGKSTIGCYLAVKHYKRALFSWRITAFLQKLFNKPIDEKPLLYSNIPLACEYVPLTSDILQRKTRPRFKSVLFVDEASLVADNETFRDLTTKERVQFFNKLIGHETHGGYMFYNTQAIGDVSVEIRRCASQVFYIHHLTKWIPFVLIAHVRECIYNEDGLNLENSVNEDVEDSLKKVILSKRVFKMFDRYAFSYFTDDLPVEDQVVNGEKLKDLKVRQIVDFNGENRTKDNFYKKGGSNEKQVKQFNIKL